MNFSLKKLLSFGSPKQVSVPNRVYGVGSSAPIWINQNNAALIGIYEDIPEVFSVISYIAELAATIPWKLYEVNGSSPKEVKQHEILSLMQKPNPLQGWSELFEQFVTFYLVCGNSYLNGVKADFSKHFDELWVLPSQYMEISTTNPWKDFRTTEIAGYRNILDRTTYNADRVLHKRQVNLRFENNQHLYGRSKLMAAIKTATALKAAYEAKVVLLQKRGALGILSSDTDIQLLALSDDEITKIQEDYQKNYGLTAEQYQILITTSKVKWQQMGLPAKDLMLLETMQQDFQTVCKVFHFPSVLLNDNIASTYNNFETARTLLYTSVEIPLLVNIAFELNNFFKLTKTNLRLAADFSNIHELQKDKLKLNQILKIQLEGGVISPEEYRKAIGLS